MTYLGTPTIGPAFAPDPYPSHFDLRKFFEDHRADIISDADHAALNEALDRADQFWRDAETNSPKVMRERIAELAQHIAADPADIKAADELTAISGKLAITSDHVARSHEMKAVGIIAREVAPLALAALKKAKPVFLAAAEELAESWSRFSGVFPNSTPEGPHPLTKAVTRTAEMIDHDLKHYAATGSAGRCHGLACALRLSRGRAYWPSGALLG